MLPQRHRLTNPAHYRAVMRGGDGRRRQRAGTDLLVVHAALDDDSALTRPPRVGFVVSKSVGNSVVRHRVVRRLRALVAGRLEGMANGCDFVVRAQPAAATSTSDQLGEALDRALRRIARSCTAGAR